MENQDTSSSLYGILAEYGTAQDLLDAAQKTHRQGYRKVDAFSPFPIEELSEVLHHPKSKVPLVCLVAGIIGLLGGYFLQYWASAINYPINVGGRPLNSWGAFIPVTFECTILAAGIATVVGMILLNGLPRHYHPVFNAENFSRASSDRFFLVIEADDPQFDADSVSSFLSDTAAREVRAVEH